MKMAADYDNLLTSLASQTCWFPADVFCCSCPNARNWCPLISFYRKLSLDASSFNDLSFPFTPLTTTSLLFSVVSFRESRKKHSTDGLFFDCKITVQIVDDGKQVATVVEVNV